MTEALVAEVGAPRPHRDRDVHRARERVETHLPVSEERDGADVARVEAVDPHDLLRRVDDLLRAERDVDQVDLRRREQAVDVVGQPEDPRALRGLVRADALEDAAAVVQRVREDMDGGVSPVDQLSVHPDLLGGLDRHLRFPS